MQTNSSSPATDPIAVTRSMLPLLTHIDQSVHQPSYDLLWLLFGSESVMYLRRLSNNKHSPDGPQAKQALTRLLTYKHLSGDSVTQRHLHTTCLGEFQVYVADQMLSPTDWKGSGKAGGLKAQTMLAYLLHCGVRGATNVELLHAIWGKRHGSEASLARVRSHLFDVLDGRNRQRGECRYIRQHGDRLFIRLELCSTDIEALAQAWQEAQRLEYEHSLQAALPCYEHVAQLYSGAYMEHILKGYAWHRERAEHFRSWYLTALDRLAANAYDHGDIELCRYYCERGLAVDQGDPFLVERLLRVLAHQNCNSEAVRVFVRYLESADLLVGTDDYYEDQGVQTYWEFWPDTE